MLVFITMVRFELGYDGVLVWFLWLLLMLMLEVVQVMALCYDSSGQVLSFFVVFMVDAGSLYGYGIG